MMGTPTRRSHYVAAYRAYLSGRCKSDLSMWNCFGETLDRESLCSIIMHEQGRARPVNAPYLARVKLNSTDHGLLLRGIGTAKIYAPPRSLGSRIMRYLQDTFRFRI